MTLLSLPHRFPFKFGHMSAAVAAQALGSFANFAFNFYILHNMEPDEFGLFGIGFVIIMVLSGFWQAFFITQYIVLAPNEDRMSFSAQVYAAMAFVSGVAAILIAAIAVVLELFANIGLFAMSIALSAVAFSFKEFHIRYAFSEERGWRATCINALMGAAMAVVLGITWLFDLKLNADLATVAYALALVITAFAGHMLSALPLSGRSRADLAKTIQKLAGGGKWAIATSVIFSLRNNAHVIVLAGILGPTAIARVNAARLYLTPPILMLPALSNVFLPQFSKALHSRGWLSLRRLQRQVGAALFVITVGYTALLLVIWPLLESVLVGSKYPNLMPIVAAWGAFAVTLMLRSIADWGAQAERRFALITKISVGVALVALAAAWLLTLTLGSIGPVLALALAELVMAAVLWMAMPRQTGGYR